MNPGPWLRAGHSECKKIPDTPENRALYRATCYTAPGLSEYISGVILHWETLFQKDKDGNAMVDLINNAGMVPGIKLDKGYDKAGMPNTAVGPLGHPETACRGLDDLEQRCAQAYTQGARFAKWRNVLQIDPENGLPSDLAILECVHNLSRYAAICQRQGLVPIVEPEIVPNGLPSDLAIQECVHNLARYAAICQRQGLVPIVEPEIVPNGSHGIQACSVATEKVLLAQF